MNNIKLFESPLEKNRRIRDEKNNHLADFYEKEKVELEEKIKNLKEFMLKINSPEIKEYLFVLENKLSILKHKLNYVDVNEI